MANRYWAIVPAAGLGIRMGSDRPKQYLQLGQETVIHHTLSTLVNFSKIEKVVVCLHADDQLWSQQTLASHPKILTTIGGDERYHSVINGLQTLTQYCHAQDWVLVHDVVRPCVRKSDLEKLIHEVAEHKIAGHEVGGVLGAPVHDTLKKVDELSGIEKTVDRSNLWRAFTPQMFRFRILRDALQFSLYRQYHQQHPVTDEASAVEALGMHPLMVEGRSDNIKITQSDDLRLAELFLSAQMGECQTGDD